jgi:hypothetical protein
VIRPLVSLKYFCALADWYGRLAKGLETGKESKT